MASALRPTLLRQVFAAPTTRAFTTTTTSSAVPAFRSRRQLQSVLRPSALVAQRAAFQTTQKKEILPPLPQKIVGTVNDAAKFPEPSPQHGSLHWSMERAVSVAILPITVAPFAAGSLNPTLDGLFIGLILIHTHIGFENCICDYFPRWRVPKTRTVSEWARWASLVLVGWGWYEFETNDVGLTEGVKRIWTA